MKLNDNIKKQIEKLTKPIFKKALSTRKNKNTMDVDLKGSSVKILWRPNNYRLLIPFNKKSFKEHTPKKPLFPMELKICNYGSKHIFRVEKGITIIIDKVTATLIYSLKDIDNKKLWYLVETNNLEEFTKYILEHKENIKKKLIRKFKEVIRLHKGIANFNKVEWNRYEDEVKGEEIIDQLPQDRIIYADTFKKVYDEGIEFTGYNKEDPTQKMINYIDNQALERKSPKIIQEINELKLEIVKQNKEYSDTLITLKQQIDSHLGLIKAWKEESEYRRLPFWKKWGKK